MEPDLTLILATTATIAVVHTIIGPDHYVPFVMIGKARNWSTGFLMLVTVLCGFGHVLGSVLLGITGILSGLSLSAVESVEAGRGNIASWLLIGFGVAYAAWGIRAAARSRKHAHEHYHGGHQHTHFHDHALQHRHVHGEMKRFTPWILFVIFILGPCEPLIPLLMYPAATGGWSEVAFVSGVYGIVTISVMAASVYALHRGIGQIRLEPLQRHIHVIAGSIIAVTGTLIRVLEL